MFSRAISSVTFNDGTSVELAPGGILVFVGPNNSGKSQTLRNIVGQFRQGRQDHEVNVVDKIAWRSIGGEPEFRDWLAQHASFHPAGQNWHKGTDNAHVSHIPYAVGGPPMQMWAGFLMHYASGEGRLAAANPAQSINFATEPLTHPLHRMYMDPLLEDELSKIAKQVFGTGLVLNRFAGSMVSLHVGKAPDVAPGRSVAPTAEYLAALSRLPLLHMQGDGMRSFLGLVLFTKTAFYPTVIVDEPEAFLHPPQAFLLGKTLASEKDADTQLILATHSTDFLRGLLDSDAKDVTIVRLTRDDSVNKASVLESASVKELWQDPLLRYSNILDGLFHEGVVVCEGDVDCGFYSAIASQVPIEAQPQLLYTHCGGKARVPLVVRSLAATGVPTRVVVDFDVLQDEGEARRIFESLAGNWGDVAKDFETVNKAIGDLGGALDRSHTKQELVRLLEGGTEAKLSSREVSALRGVLKAPNGWASAKNAGTQAVPSGQAVEALERLTRAFRHRGLFVVPVGEVERFIPSVGGHGPKWLAGVFEANKHRDSAANADAVKFMKSVLESFGNPFSTSPQAGGDDVGIVENVQEVKEGD